MPSAPLRYCGEPGCGEKVTGDLCSKHKGSSDRMRGSAASRGYGHKWRAFRLVWLAEHPFCGDRTSGPSTEHSLCAATDNSTLGEVVDHIRPHRGDQTLMWDRANLQTLCTTCHNRKTASEGGIVYAPTVGKRYVVTGQPGSGKTTWVDRRRKPGDVVFDLDVIAGVVSQVPRFPRPDAVVQATLAMRDGLLDWLASSSPSCAVFVIVTNPSEATHIATQIQGEQVDLGLARK